MSNRFMTDGAGQEVCAQMEKVIARFNGTTPPEVTPGTYDSKDFLSEETGRALAGKVSDLADAVGTFIENNGKNISGAVVTLGASLTYNGSAQTQTVASVKLGSVTLRAGTDYDISGNVATNAGNYTLIVSGKGDYTGFVFVDWSIAKVQGSISVSETSVNILGAAGTTKQITVNVTSGYGDLVATSSAPSIATVSMLGNTLTITSVANGNATITIRLVGNYSAEASITANVVIANFVLNDNTWEQIRNVADNDLGASLWSVGDTKAITLNGTVGTKAYNNVTLWVYILGFNHNASVEGNHLIHFGGFKTAQTDGVDVTLDDSHYDSTSTSGDKWFNMNHWGNYNYGGWSRCDMRYDILGSTDVEPDGYGTSPSSVEEGNDPTSTCATSPVAGTLMAAFQSDLRAVMKPATKYTDNTGGESNNVSSVTATQDYLPLLAEFEVQGKRTHANSAEQNYQTQYDYYANGNSKVKYRQTSTGTSVRWWWRSPYATSGSSFVCASPLLGDATSSSVYTSHGVSPAFFI